MYIVENTQLNIRLYEGNPIAYEELFKQNFPRMLGYCRLFIHDEAQANDLVQECFVRLWEKREAIRISESVESLLFVMLRNRCLNYLRDQKVRLSDSNINLLEDSDLQHLYQLDFTGKEEKSLEEKLLESIHLSVDNLPEKRKIVFIKAKIEGKKNKQIAEEMGISVKAVEKNLHLAKEQIRQEMLLKYPLLAVIIVFLLK